MIEAARFGLATDLADEAVLARAIEHCAERGIVLPAFAELAAPSTIPEKITPALEAVDPDEPHPLNLFRVHWHNDRTRRERGAVPAHVVLPEALTGVPVPIAFLLGDRFCMIGAHKVLAAYACLAPRLVTGRFDPTCQRAVWPSTGNYCRGGVAISRILGCRGVAVLPAGMSAERFAWLERWVASPADIVRTPGSESNVREIYEACDDLARDGANVVLNQFCEFGNHLAHLRCTAAAAEAVLGDLRKEHTKLALAAFVAATGSAGTLAAGDALAETHGSKTVAAEALECPTMLANGFGEHNIQGIGDKHIPLIHNVMRTDLVAGVSDASTDSLFLLFGTDEGRAFLEEERGIARETIEAFEHFGLSSLCNLCAAILTAKKLGLGRNDLILSVATDGAAMYASEKDRARAEHFGGRFDRAAAARCFDAHVLGLAAEHCLELDERERERIFNLGYFTWVEQRGVGLGDFEERRGQRFWKGIRECLPAWDARIAEFNAQSGALGAL